jgi:ribosomal protein S21
MYYKQSEWVNDTGRVFKGTTVLVKNGDLNKALRKLKKRLQDEGWHNELKKREHYVSKGEKRRKRFAAAVIREKKQQSENDPFA